MTDWMKYGKIQEHKRNGLTKSQVQRRLGVDYKTVLKYWDVTPDEFATKREQAHARAKKADPHKAYVIQCLTKNPDMSAAQLYDWIKEKTGLPQLAFQERSFRDYVKNIREEYDIKKSVTTRQYEAVEELPMGKQGQVDMGELLLETVRGGRKKVYCFAMVLSNSRHKYVWWQERPFTTESFLVAHNKAFSFYGGRPRELVYDQDKILAVSENHGDLIYTEGFQNYISTMGFDVFLCHGSDPESKGKIENVIKYVKYGFAKHRIFTDLDSFSADCLAWLKRTGNAKIHDTTKQIPAEVFTLEKEHLIPVSESTFVHSVNKSIPYQVRKDNIVVYKGNRYRVPKGTYQPGKQAYMILQGDTVSITDVETGEIYASHPLCHEKGKLIGQKRNERDKSKTLLELKAAVRELFGNPAGFNEFLGLIHKEKTRYYRDQLGVLKNLFEEHDAKLIRNAYFYCMEKELYSAGAVKSAVYYLEESAADEKQNEKDMVFQLPEKYRGNCPEVRDLSLYEAAMERGMAVNG